MQCATNDESYLKPSRVNNGKVVSTKSPQSRTFPTISPTVEMFGTDLGLSTFESVLFLQEP